VVVLAALAAIGCGGSGNSSVGASPTASSALTVRGSVNVPVSLSGMLGLPEEQYFEGGPCVTDDGYDDLTEGTQVVVADDQGETLALGTLRAAVLRAGPEGGLSEAKCEFGFVVSGVSASEDFYTVSVGRRGGQKYSRGQVAQPLSLTLR
jgi:hypothetical protein